MKQRVPSDAHKRAQAEEIGQQGLLYLAEDRGRLKQFLTKTGLDPGELYAQAGTPEVWAAVLDYLLADESQLLVFAATAGLDPVQVAQAHHFLTGEAPGDGW